MKQGMRTALVFVAWVLGAGSCLMWGRDRLWVAGLGVSVMSLATLALAYFPDTSPQDKTAVHGGRGDLFDRRARAAVYRDNPDQAMSRVGGAPGAGRGPRLCKRRSCSARWGSAAPPARQVVLASHDLA